MLVDVEIKYLARIQNWARRHCLKFVVFVVFSPILTLVNKYGYFRLTKELDNENNEGIFKMLNNLKPYKAVGVSYLVRWYSL